MLFIRFIKDWHSSAKNALLIGLSSGNLHDEIAPFRLFRGNTARAKNSEIKFSTEKKTSDFSRIRCPHCKWEPKEASRWFCADAGFPEFYAGGCGAMWNTFATGGVCPGCAHRWRWTTCLRCAEWSRHADWYAEKSDV